MKNNFFKELNSNELIQKITKDGIVFIENKYNRKLPESYLNFLEIQNGGYINYNKFPKLEHKINIDFISGIKGSKLDTLEQSDYYIKEWNLPKQILLFSGEGHWWICFDYRNINENNEPKISYLDSEYGADQVIAESFQDFIERLY
jgi:hypothetical protein